MNPLGDILVLGLGASGVATARYCVALPGDEVVSVTAVDGADSEKLREAAAELEALGVSVALGAEELDGEFDLCIASPGIPPASPLMVQAKAHCREVVSEIEFAYRRSAGRPWVAITGTNGKTTTTALVAHLFNGGGIPARAVGNIGTPAIEALTEAQAYEVLVAEVSSFQLALTSTFHPRAAVLLNITPDHIDWHGSFETYAADKAKIFANLSASDVAVIDVDDAGSAPYARRVSEAGVRVVTVGLGAGAGEGATDSDAASGAVPGAAGCATVRGGTLVLDAEADEIRLVDADELQIKGPHNASNALAAAAAAHALGVGAADLRWGLRTFEPIEHRLEPAGEVGGVSWFNDSKATNPDAVMKAVAAFDANPLILLLGGRNKNNAFTELARAVAESSAKAVVVFGEAADEIASAFADIDIEVTRTTRLENAVRAAAELACAGDSVVLSPACASFDEFSNYEERGHEFKRMIAEMAIMAEKEQAR